jgi:DNA-binding NtrC family response regulator
VVILDIKMPGIGGMETLKLIKRYFPTIEVIMLTGHGTGEYAVEALMWGAINFLIKPASIEEMIDKVEEASARQQLLAEKIRMARAIEKGRQKNQRKPIDEDGEE